MSRRTRRFSLPWRALQPGAGRCSLVDLPRLSCRRGSSPPARWAQTMRMVRGVTGNISWRLRRQPQQPREERAKGLRIKKQGPGGGRPRGTRCSDRGRREWRRSGWPSGRLPGLPIQPGGPVGRHTLVAVVPGIQAPLPYVAVHILQAPGVGREAPHRGGLLPRLTPRAVSVGSTAV